MVSCLVPYPGLAPHFQCAHAGHTPGIRLNVGKCRRESVLAFGKGVKLHIIGGPGSGKSFIARHLAGRYGIPVLDLDEIFWDHKERDYGARADPEKRDAELSRFVAKESWIVEGVYYRWLVPSFQRADRIFVLTPPLWIRQVRITQRFFRRKLGLDRSKQETFRGQMELMEWNRKYDKDNLVRAMTMMEELSLSPTRCSTLASVLQHLDQYPNRVHGPDP